MNQNAGNFGWYIKWNGQFRFGPTGIFGTMGAFHSTQKSGNFGWYTKWNGPFRFGPTGIVGTSFEGGLVWPVWSFRSVGPKCPFPFDKIVVYSAALLHPAYKNNNQTRGGLGEVCATGMHSSIGHVKFLKFQTGIFVEWKAPSLRVVLFDRSGQFGRSDRNYPFPLLDKIVVPSTALLYPASKNNNLTRGGLGRVCATGMQDAPFLGVRPLEKSLWKRPWGVRFSKVPISIIYGPVKLFWFTCKIEVSIVLHLTW